MRLLARWMRNKEGGKAPPEARILQVALKFGMSPQAVEEMPAFWFNRCVIWLKAESEGDKLS